MAKKQQNRNPSQNYLATVKGLERIPNFWMSEEYIDKAELVWSEDGTLQGFKCKGTDEWFFPPIAQLGTLTIFEFQNQRIYSGFPLDAKTRINSVGLLDYQFVYDPINFIGLEGGKWKVYRKNIKKYAKRNPGNIIYKEINIDSLVDDVKRLLLKWTERRTIYDNEVMIKYLFYGENRWGLFNDGKLVGMNVFDENFKYINFRYCIDDGTPFLNELLRHYFYTNRPVLTKAKLVNDGGCLDSEGLMKFKLKLNPVVVYKVFSYKGKQDENK